MDFSRCRSKEARRIFEDESVSHVYGIFSDGCMRCFNMDISQHQRPYLTAITARQVRAFVLHYGRDDAAGIVEELFGVGHEGKWRGQVVGVDIFSSHSRWMADKLLMEHQANIPCEEVNVSDDADRTARLEEVKARIKSSLA